MKKINDKKGLWRSARPSDESALNCTHRAQSYALIEGFIDYYWRKQFNYGC